MKKGDIVLIPFPFTDLTGNKKRPAIVLNKIAIVDKALLIGLLGQLDKDIIKEINRNLINFLKLDD